MSNLPIGIFDSGVGGLSIWKELKALLPNENIIYIADSKNCPYGIKTHKEILTLSEKNTEFLLKNKCKIIVVACNTATAAAIDTLRNNYNIPFVGMEPAIKQAALNTNTGKIGVLATIGTFNGRLFKETSEKYTKNIEQFVQIGTGLVELVENGKANSNESIPILKRNLDKMIQAGVDQIVLGCTHYPFLINNMRKIVPANVQIINPAPAIALRTEQILKEHNMINSNDLNKDSLYSFYSTGNIRSMSTILKNLNIANDVVKISL